MLKVNNKDTRTVLKHYQLLMDYQLKQDKNSQKKIKK